MTVLLVCALQFGEADLAYLLTAGVPPGFTVDHETTLVQLYHDALQRSGKEALARRSIDDVWRLYFAGIVCIMPTLVVAATTLLAARAALAAG